MPTFIIPTFFNLFILFHSFLLNACTALFTHEYLIYSCVWGTLIRITLVRFEFFFFNLHMFHAINWVISCHNITVPPHSTTTFFFVNCWIFTLAVSFYELNSWSWTYKTENFKIVTSEPHPLVWLSPTIMTLCDFFSNIYLLTPYSRFHLENLTSYS